MKTILLIFSFLFSATIFNIYAQVKHIRWGTNTDVLTGLTITWRNKSTADSIKWGYTPAFEKGTFLGARRTGYTENFFNYVFTTVNSGSIIYYKIYDSNSKSWGQAKQFKTAPAESTRKFSFAAIGDSRDGMSAWTKVSNQANGKYKTDFTVFNGDIVADASQASLWDKWFDAGSAYLENNLVLHALGNHDAKGTPTYLNTFEFPSVNGQRLYYSVIYANAIFITLNSEAPGNSAQATWLKNTLAAAKANPAITWKIISFHRPFYTVGDHAGEMNSYFTTWWKCFDDYGVDLIVNGHDHMYERTKPINRNVSTTSPVATYGSGPKEGRCQIVCGGAGAPFYAGSANAYIQKLVANKNHFCKFNISPLPGGGSQLCDSTFDSSGNLIDNFCISKQGQVTGTPVQNQVFNPITVAPNPVENNLTLKYSSSLKEEVLVQIYDVTGKQMFSQIVQKNEEELEFHCNALNYAKGIYFIQVVTGKQKDDAIFIVK